MEVRLGDVGVLGEEMFDMILANITRNTLVRDMLYIQITFWSRGTDCISGFLAEDVQYVLNEAYRCELNHLNTQEEANWISLSFVKHIES